MVERAVSYGIASCLGPEPSALGSGRGRFEPATGRPFRLALGSCSRENRIVDASSTGPESSAACPVEGHVATVGRSSAGGNSDASRFSFHQRIARRWIGGSVP